MTQTREILPGVFWINENYADGPKQLHVSVYLLRSGDNYVLVDTGSFNDREAIQREINEIIGSGSIDAIIVSHADLPHSGNVPWFREQFQDVEIVSSSNYPEIVGLPSEAKICPLGDSMGVAGRTFSFIYPPLCDLQHSTWIHDAETKVLFTADGLGNYHQPAQQDVVYSELADELSVEDIREFHIDTLRWMKYVDPEKLRGDLESIFKTYDVSYIAPIHGNPIERDSIDSYMEKFMAAVERIADAYDPRIEDVTDLSKSGNEL